MNDLNREAYLQSVEKRPLLDGRFEKPTRLGASGGNGNFSLLFTADDRNTKSEIVLKFFHPDERHDAYRWGCFDREARILQKLSGQKGIIELIAPRGEFIETFTAGPVSMKVGLSPCVRHGVKRRFTVRCNLIVLPTPNPARCASAGEAEAGSAGAQLAEE